MNAPTTIVGNPHVEPTIFYHDGSELPEGFYIHTKDGGMGPYLSEEDAKAAMQNYNEQVTD